jgi:hypothetical protein
MIPLFAFGNMNTRNGVLGTVNLLRYTPVYGNIGNCNHKYILNRIHILLNLILDGVDTVYLDTSVQLCKKMKYNMTAGNMSTTLLHRCFLKFFRSTQLLWFVLGR